MESSSSSAERGLQKKIEWMKPSQTCIGSADRLRMHLHRLRQNNRQLSNELKSLSSARQEYVPRLNLKQDPGDDTKSVTSARTSATAWGGNAGQRYQSNLTCRGQTVVNASPAKLEYYSSSQTLAPHFMRSGRSEFCGLQRPKTPAPQLYTTWQVYLSSQNEPYFYCFETGKSQWDDPRPMEQQVALPIPQPGISFYVFAASAHQPLNSARNANQLRAQAISETDRTNNFATDHQDSFQISRLRNQQTSLDTQLYRGF